MRTLVTAALAALLTILLSPGLMAQIENYPDDFDETGTPPISGSIGVGIGYSPEFVGSDESEAKFLPVVFLNYGPLFLSSEKGLGVKFELFDGALELSPAVTYRPGRDENDSHLLSGLGDVKGVAALGGTVAYKFDDFVLSVRTFKGLSDYGGLTMDLKAAYLNRNHESFNYGLSVSTTLADKDYNMAFFGITPTQAARSGYPAYEAKSSFNDVGVKGTFDYFITPSFSVDVFAGYSHLIGEAADSPLVLRGSEDQFSTGLAFMYHFGR